MRHTDFHNPDSTFVHRDVLMVCMTVCRSTGRDWLRRSGALSCLSFTLGFYLHLWCSVTRLSIQHLAQKWVRGEIHRSCSACVQIFIFTGPPKRLAASATFLLERDTLYSDPEPFTPFARRTPRRFVFGGHEKGNLHSSICGLSPLFFRTRRTSPSDGNHQVIQIHNECAHQGQETDGITPKSTERFEVNNEVSVLTWGHIPGLYACKLDSPHNTLDPDWCSLTLWPWSWTFTV